MCTTGQNKEFTHKVAIFYKDIRKTRKLDVRASKGKPFSRGLIRLKHTIHPVAQALGARRGPGVEYWDLEGYAIFRDNWVQIPPAEISSIAPPTLEASLNADPPLSSVLFFQLSKSL